MVGVFCQAVKTFGIKGLQIIDSAAAAAKLSRIEKARLDTSFDFETRYFDINRPTDQFFIIKEQPPISAELLYNPNEVSIAAQRAIIKAYKPAEIQRQIYPKDINKIKSEAEIINLDYFSNLKKPGARTESGQEVSLYMLDPASAALKTIYDFYKNINPEKSFKFDLPFLEVNKAPKLPEIDLTAQTPFMDITKPPVFNYALDINSINNNAQTGIYQPPIIENPQKIIINSKDIYKPAGGSVSITEQENDIFNKGIPAFSTRPKIKQSQELSQAQEQKQSQELKPIIITEQIFKPFISPGIKRNVQQPKKPSNIYSTRKENKQNQVTTGFNVFVKIKGQFKKINLKPTSAKQALKLGSQLVENTSAATFKIKPQNENKKIIFGNLKNFYIKNGLYIEKPSSRINTPGELRSITSKGRATQKIRNLFKNAFKKIR